MECYKYMKNIKQERKVQVLKKAIKILMQDNTLKRNEINIPNEFEKKGENRYIITTIIVSYNHEKYIAHAIDSALMQCGNFKHEIIISDDGSTDKTVEIIKHYAKKYPDIIKNISESKNIGVGENYKKCFKFANGKYIAILEGDDFWIDPLKLEKQSIFLDKNFDCSMVFNRFLMFDEETLSKVLLKRWENLPEKIDEDIFISAEFNPIANFSCTMFRSEIMKILPSDLYIPRLSEISLSVFLLQNSKIGFCKDISSVYRRNMNSVWTGSSRLNQLNQSINILKTTVKYSKNRNWVRKLKELQVKLNQLK